MRDRERAGRQLFAFIAVMALLAVLAAVLIFAAARSSRSDASARFLAAEVVLAEVLIGSALWVRFFRRSVVNANKISKMYAQIPPEYRSAQGGEGVSEDQIISDIMNYHTFLQNKNLMMQFTLTQTKLSALQSQINPHFLFNTLESIRGYCLLKREQEIADIAEALATLFRNCLQKTNSLVTMREELNNVKCYLLIQGFRFPGKINYSEDLDEDPRLLNCKLPNLSIQPIIENAIFHGIEEKVGVGTIELQAYLTDSRLVIRVCDDGLGISESEIARINALLQKNAALTGGEGGEENRQSVGMSNINTRIKLHFGEEYGLSVASTRNVGTQIEITLPILC